MLLLITLAAYAPAMKAGFFWDDREYLYEADGDVIVDKNKEGGLRKIWWTTAPPQYYPLVFTSFWLEYRIWGLDKNDPKNPRYAVGYHVTNILLHAAVAVLAWLILRKLGVPGAWFAAAIFALHPENVQSVAWITERKNTLSGLFYMVSVLCCLKFSDRDGWRYYLIGLAAFVLAVLSKTSVVSLPIAALLLLWLRKQVRLPELAVLLPSVVAIGAGAVVLSVWLAWRIHLTPADRCALIALPLGALAIGLLIARRRRFFPLPVVLGLIPMVMLGWFMGRLVGWYEFHREKEEYAVAGAMPIDQAMKLAWMEGDEAKNRSDYDITGPQRVLLASRALLHYAKKLVIPYPLSVFYYRWSLEPGGELDAGIIANYQPVALVLAVGIAAILLSVRYGRGIIIGFAFFVATIFPALGFFDLYIMRYSFVVDHFPYLANLGLIALGAAGLTLLGRRLGGTARAILNGASVRAGVLAAAVLLTLGSTTFVRAKTFQTEEGLWEDTIAKVPTAWGARINLGLIYGNKAATTKGAESRRFQDRAAEQFRAMVDGGCPWFEPYGYLGQIHATRMEFADAERLFRKAIELEPRVALFRSYLARLFVVQNRPNEALAVFEEAAKVPRETYRLTGQWIQLFEDWANLLEKNGKNEAAAEKRARAQILRDEIVAFRRKWETRKAKPAPAGTQSPVDLGDAKTDAERRRAYIRLVDEAVARGDFARAMDVVLAGRAEYPTSVGLHKRYGLLLAASPDPALRDVAQAVEFSEKLRDALARNNQLDAEMMEVLAASYAAARRFQEAVFAAQQGIQLAAQNPRQAAVGNRLRDQLRLYQANRPYLLPTPATTPNPTATHPVQ